jgi:eukaryotic-like serine/threonine-protein kinase
VSEIRFGRYSLLRKLAAGGMAEVYLAREWAQSGFFRDLVVKRLFSNLAEHGPTLRSFQFEARLMAELCHPNIPQVYDLGRVEDSWFVAMEYVDGQTVADLVRLGARAGVAMPLPVAVGLVMQACEALHHAHERVDRAGHALSIVHRDVTPQNLIVTRDGVVKLLDFGVAQSAAIEEPEGTVKGTYSYMAPEQVRGRNVDRRADVFALGVILYELTTFTRLYRGSEIQVMTQIVEEDVVPPSVRVDGYPPELEEIVLAALRRDADYRIASAADLAVHLEHYAMQHGMLVGPRSIAMYVNDAWPAERVLDHSLSLIEPIPFDDHEDLADDDLEPDEDDFDPDEGEVLLLDQRKGPRAVSGRRRDR